MGFFLRAETMHGFYTYLEQNPRRQRPDRPDEPVFHEMSHGESFLTVVAGRFDSPGFYCLDEPEAALSFTATLSLIGSLLDLADAGGQVLCATHSPVLAAMPGARILEVGDWGLRETAWDELELVWHWRRFLGSPEALPPPPHGRLMRARRQDVVATERRSDVGVPPDSPVTCPLPSRVGRSHG